MNSVVSINEKSDSIKYNTCEKCKDQLKSVLSDKQLQLFEDTFYKVAKDYVFKEKGELKV